MFEQSTCKPNSSETKYRRHIEEEDLRRCYAGKDSPSKNGLFFLRRKVPNLQTSGDLRISRWQHNTKADISFEKRTLIVNLLEKNS